MRSTLCVALLVAVALLAGCATRQPDSLPEQPIIYAVPTEVPATVMTVAPITAPVVVKPPDLRPQDLRSTYAPSVCGAPEHRIRGYRGVGLNGVGTHLQVLQGYTPDTPPVPPLLVDLDGDGARDALVVLSCEVAGVPGPDTLVLYTAGPRPIAVAGLDPLQRQRHAAVRSLRVRDAQIVVEWAGFDSAQGPVTPYEAVVTYVNGSLVLQQAGRSSGPHEVVVETGAFVTPDGNIRCVMQTGMSWCSARKTTWKPAVPPAGSSCEPAAYGRTLAIVNGAARRSCATQDDSAAAVLGGALTGWHRSGWDPMVRVGAQPSAGLAVGSSMRAGSVVCAVRTADSVHCRDRQSRSSFILGRTSHALS
ncbi:hypothetical protein [Gephyromycinifex aptenodytis]|uniref:hypothetical protein n=1 Tax=Gephyromycinifex aptenodytis TaxID=2716227 RepID=UPI0014468A48|nr:hypothetical protein [Gephyromycinifex aptenodytis]